MDPSYQRLGATDPANPRRLGFAGPTSPDTSRRSDRVLSPAMAQKRPSRRRSRDVRDEKENGAASGKQWPPAAAQPAPPPPSRREVRPYIYAGLDFAMAVLYALMLLQVPTENALHAALLWSMVGAVAVAGAGMLVRNRLGWWAAAAGCALLIAVAILLLVLIVMSASFLAGVYGSMGRGAAMISLAAGALIIELVGLLPAFQLKFLRTRAGRRHFAPGPAR
jgi:hypothetical protein